ncbi:hypothetical protein VNI00_013119 [Paramarasmius palmivorus]|uniref:G-protein coupled receptors family 2 profile 2 domain-containing protein n=1 Tax=Paramarasmius palmivorus TaxID=297713 RepID=A0AAW0BZN0_9AGAR
MDNRSTPLLHLFFSLQLIALVGLVLILATVILSGGISRRHPTWINFIIAWIISCTSYILLLGHPLSWNPPYELCLAQAALVYTVPSLAAAATFALILHITMFFRASFSLPDSNSRAPYLTFWLVALPYIPAIIMFGYSLGVGLKDPEGVTRLESGMYCHLDNGLPGKLSSALVLVFTSLCILLELYLLWNGGNGLSMFGHVKATLIRVLGFSAFVIVAVVLSLIFFFADDHGPALSIIIALVPNAAVLVFGTQDDLLRAWASLFRSIFTFLRPKRTQTSSDGVSIPLSQPTPSSSPVILNHGPGFSSRTSQVSDTSRTSTIVTK